MKKTETYASVLGFSPVRNLNVRVRLTGTHGGFGYGEGCFIERLRLSARAVR